MAITATGFFKQNYVLRYMISASSAFQTVVGAGDAATARASISLHDAAEVDMPLPRAVIERGEISREASGISLGFSQDMQLMVHFEFRIPVAAGAVDRTDEEVWFTNQIAAICADLEEQVNARVQVESLNVLAIRRYRITNGPDRITPEEDELVDADSEPSHNLAGWFCSVQFDLAG